MIDLPQHDLVDVRLVEAIRQGGCPICVVRARSERATLDAIIGERVLDIGFRAELERTVGFCRRHVAELVETDQREGGGILGASILLGAVLKRRLDEVTPAVGSSGRGLRSRVRKARRRPRCIACSQGVTAVDTAAMRFIERSHDQTWALVLSSAPFCFDDFLLVWEVAASERAMNPVVDAQSARFADLNARLEGYARHSSHDRRHLLTDDERSAAGEATDALGGDRH
jgi:Family of unknown function (DUF6062)